VKPGVEVRMAKGSRDLDLVAAALELASRGQPVSWLPSSSFIHPTATAWLRTLRVSLLLLPVTCWKEHYRER
jgi:hypothetical protein